MDTIQLDLIFKKGIEFSRREEDEIRRRLDGLKSPFDYTYCDVIKEISYNKKEVKIIVKLSYPRFYYENNAYLITTCKECEKVQKYFVEQLQKDDLLENINKIKITRIDIPFTYMMKDEKKFHDYSNLYKIFALAFTQKYDDVEAKSIVDTIRKREQTIIYTDTPTISAYNMKVIIYNQAKNLKAKYSEDINIEKTLRDYPDLHKRMRIEMSKRINRQKMSLKKFAEYELFKEYREKYKKELIKLMFDKKLLEEIYDQEIEALAEELREYKNIKKKSFKYEPFIYKHQEEIYDYTILRGAIKEIISKHKTRETAITKVKKVLKELEEDQGKIVIGVKKIIEEIEETIKKSFREKKPKSKRQDEWDGCPF